MKILTKILMTLLVASSTIGCSKESASPRFHISAVSVCESIDVVGTMNGREYSLSAIRPQGADFSTACYDPIRPEDVGKTMEAHFSDNGDLLIDVPDVGPVFFATSSVREAK